MSADIEISSTSSEQEFPYRALSTTAIASVIFAVVSLLGLFVWAFLGLAFVGMVLGFVGFSKIKRFPQEFAGHSLAMTGIVLNVLVILGGISLVILRGMLIIQPAWRWLLALSADWMTNIFFNSAWAA